MKKHKGMRPQDVVVLLKLVSMRDEQWYVKDIAHDLGISQSEVSESLNRSKIAGLLDTNKKKLNRLALIEFIQYGLSYVFPAELGTLVRGVPTAHSAPPLNEFINAETAYVWPYGKGQTQGLSVEPMHPKVPEAAMNDQQLYRMLALVDAIRVGRQREKQMAIEKLKKIILKDA